MSGEIEELLKKLTVKQLKKLADSHEVDVSGKRKKKDLISAIAESGRVQKEDVEEALGIKKTEEAKAPKMEEPEEALDVTEAVETATVEEPPMVEKSIAAQADDELSSIAKELDNIGLDIATALEDIDKPHDISEEDLTKLDSLIADAKKLSINFREAEDLMGQAKNRFENRKFVTVIEYVDRAAKSARNEISNFQKFALSLSISSSEHVIKDLREAGVDVSSIEKLLVVAKRVFEKGHLEADWNIVSKLDSLVMRLHQNQMEKAENVMKDTQDLLETARTKGVDVRKAEGYLSEAQVRLVRNKDFLKCMEYSKKAKEFLGDVPVPETVIRTKPEEVENVEEETEDPGAVEEGVPEEMIEKDEVEEAPDSSEVVEEMEEKEGNNCPKCGDALSHIEKYDRYYCYNCKKYAPKTRASDVKKCPDCNDNLSYVEKYERHYCYKCKKYAPKDY